MGLKRKRNLKVDVITKYSVFILSELDSEYLEDYIEARDTGMEADEEKEIQLQKIIQGNGGNIPLPVIVQIENPVRRLYGPIPLKSRIKWNSDVSNECIEIQEEVQKMDELFLGGIQTDVTIVPSIEERGAANFEVKNLSVCPEQDAGLRKAPSATSTPQSVSPSQNDIVVLERDMSSLVAVNGISDNIRKAFLLFGDSMTAIANRNEKLIDYILHRVILRYERTGYEAYTCFRRRIFHPTFKSRRNEAIMLEKLERMSAEFHALEDLCSLLMEKTKAEGRHLRQTNKLLEAYHKADLSRKLKRRYKKGILGVVEAQTPSRLSFNVHATMINRDKVAYLRNIKSSTDLLIDVNYHSKIGHLLWEDSREEDICEDKSVSGGTSHSRKKMCRRCENKWGSVFFTDDRQHNV